MNCEPCKNDDDVVHDSTNYMPFTSSALPHDMVMKQEDTNASSKEDESFSA
ncbi:hypothetical protein IC619_007210 [Hazenella sp. IB182353]|uniref:hypothetical protein n=1 Tax=Polycladospora coralii TaxID=2771432 RepID=UPI001746F048|nr:hypothetical protein [Polycladospora coralii]MBS7530278.1 hypothetical protein [Polycladospora coralii]